MIAAKKVHLNNMEAWDSGYEVVRQTGHVVSDRLRLRLLLLEGAKRQLFDEWVSRVIAERAAADEAPGVE